jgi:hypothetical protein
VEGAIEAAAEEGTAAGDVDAGVEEPPQAVSDSAAAAMTVTAAALIVMFMELLVRRVELSRGWSVSLTNLT